MEIIVPDDQLSLAIGRRGQNVRLASQLTGWRLDIVSESKVKEVKDLAFGSLGRFEGVGDITMQTLYNYGIRCAADLLGAELEFLAKIPGIDEDKAAFLKEDAVRVVAEEQAEDAEAKRQEGVRAREQAKIMFDEVVSRATRLPEADRLVRVKGLGPELISKFEAAGLHFVEDFAALTSLDEAAEHTEISREKVDELRHAASVFIQKEQDGVELPVSSEDAGPEEDYAPSELLVPPVDEVAAEASA